jgi:hypothetical protein
VASSVVCVVVVVAGIRSGRAGRAPLALVSGVETVSPSLVVHPQRQRAARSRFIVSDIRAFLEDDEENGELGLNRWLRLRAEHDDGFVP